MSLIRFAFALVIIGSLAAAQAFLHIHLTSLVIAPLVFALWLSFLPEPPEWLFFLLIVGAELFSSTPPGAITLAILLPLVIKNVLASIPPRFSIRFLVLTMAITGGQMAIIILFMLYRLGTNAFPWPSALYAVFGTGAAAFIVNGLWHELSVYDERA